MTQVGQRSPDPRRNEEDLRGVQARIEQHATVPEPELPCAVLMLHILLLDIFRMCFAKLNKCIFVEPSKMRFLGRAKRILKSELHFRAWKNAFCCVGLLNLMAWVDGQGKCKMRFGSLGKCILFCGAP